MKTKDKDRLEGQSRNNAEREKSPESNESVRNDRSGKRQRTSADDNVEKTLSEGYVPDGPGGNYRGV
jgi:hypothetical protein